MKGVYRNGELRGPLPLCVGVDVGGTWVRVAASRGQGRIRTIVTPADRDLRRLAPLLRAVWQRRRWRRGDIAALVVASRALWTRSPDAVGRIAALAPRVLARARRGDSSARVITRAGQTQLAEHVRDAVRALALRAPVHVSWAGSVLENHWFRSGLIRAVTRQGV